MRSVGNRNLKMKIIIIRSLNNEGVFGSEKLQTLGAAQVIDETLSIMPQVSVPIVLVGTKLSELFGHKM